MELDEIGVAITQGGGERNVDALGSGCLHCNGNHRHAHTCGKARSRSTWTAAPERAKRRRSSEPTDVPALLHGPLPALLQQAAPMSVEGAHPTPENALADLPPPEAPLSLATR